MPTSSDIEKLKTAKSLIESKQYKQARNVLKNLNHPTAQKWLAKLEQLDPPKKIDKRIAYLLIALMLLVGCGAIAFVVIAPPLSRINSTLDASLVEMRTTGTMIRPRASLEVYCENALNKANCELWAQTMMDSFAPLILDCNTRYDWIDDRDNYTNCLRNAGLTL